jgi:uncharacterized membrane protein
MLSAVTLFALAAWRQHPGYDHGDVTTGGFALSLAGLIVLIVGGWLGGSVVFVHGARVVAAADRERGLAGGDGAEASIEEGSIRR